MKLHYRTILIIATLSLFVSCEKNDANDYRTVGLVSGWGDSLTYGSGGKTAGGYTAFLSQLTKKEVSNFGIPGETSTQIMNRFLKNDEHEKDEIVIWAGRNNYSKTEIIKSDIAKMVQKIKHKRYLILSLINGNYGKYERKGEEGYQSFTKINSYLEETYGNHYFDVRSYLIAHHLKTDQDLEDVKNDIVPSSLRVDGIHLNDKGYRLVATGVYERLREIAE